MCTVNAYNPKKREKSGVKLINRWPSLLCRSASEISTGMRLVPTGRTSCIHQNRFVLVSVIQEILY